MELFEGPQELAERALRERCWSGYTCEAREATGLFATAMAAGFDDDDADPFGCMPDSGDEAAQGSKAS